MEGEEGHEVENIIKEVRVKTDFQNESEDWKEQCQQKYSGLQRIWCVLGM
jgi:hypothetical protein